MALLRSLPRLPPARLPPARLPPPSRRRSLPCALGCRLASSSSTSASSSSSGDLTPHSSPATKAYSHTLLLPKPSFPLTPPSAEEQRQRYGARTGPDLYAWQRTRTDALPDSSDFVFLDGPPYANGDLHMGHAMNKVLKDVINRYQVLRGRRVAYVPGWDCHGLPIENKALQALSTASSAATAAEAGQTEAADFTTLPPARIREAAEEVARTAVEGQRETFQSLGIMADWSAVGTYRTLDTSFVGAQLRIFQQMVAHGLIYASSRPTYYSPSSRTALAEAELNYVETHQSESCWVRLAVPKGDEGALADVLRDAGEVGEVGVVIWTTTAWTLGSNMAVMVNPELQYTLLRSPSHGLLLSAVDRMETLAELLGEDLVPVGAPFEGTTLLQTRYSPLFPSGARAGEATNPIIAGAHVTSQSGSGLVHCAPAHGLDDYRAYTAVYPHSSAAAAAGVQGDFPSPVDDAGCFTSGVHDSLAGHAVFGKGTELMFSLLKERGVLLKQQRVEHKYPYDWKTKEPVLVRATRQWFANLDGIKEQVLEALQDVQFVPSSSRARLESFVRSRSEWCISRQRTWGVPIPALYSVATNEPHLTPESLSHVLSVLEAHGGVQAWWDLPAEAFVSDAMAAGAEGKGGWRKGTDTMDVWFDSGSAWSLLGPRAPGESGEQRPLADVVLEGSDQHRGWFQSLLLTYLSASADAHGNNVAPRAPYRTVITHGMVLDDERKKMSKSDGNILSPASVMDGSAFAGESEGAQQASQPSSKKKGAKRKKQQQTHYGPDTLRVWAATNDYTSDSSIGKQAIDEASNHLFLVRRILRFLTGSVGKDTRPISEFARDDLTLADKYVLHLLAEFDASIKHSYESFAFHPVMKETATLLNHLSAFYIDMTRDSLYSDSPGLPSRQIVLSVFQAVLNSVSQAVAPIAPFMSEELAEHREDVALPAESAFSQPWQEAPVSWTDTDVKASMQALLEVKTHVSALLASAREDKKANVGRESHLEMQLDSSDVARVITENRAILTNLFGVSHVTIVATPIDEPQPWEYSTSVPTSSAEADGPTAGLQLRIYPSSMHKCPRCWDFTSPREEMLCVRCETVVRELEGPAP